MEKGVLLYKKILLFSVVFIALCSAAVIAAHVVKTNTGGTSFSVNDGLGFIYNISVNNTDAGQTANITQVNITFPSSFIYTSGSNLTTAHAGANLTFVNTSTVLSWSNFTDYVINGTGGTTLFYFSFNATASTPGSYNITITTLNRTGPFSSNITVTVNDTTSPSSIVYADPTPVTQSNVSSIPVNVTATDAGTVSAIVVRLFNSTRNLINSSTSTTSPLYINFTGLNDGTYYVNATINDTFNNANSTSTRTYIVDSTVPSVSMSCTPNTVNKNEVVTCACSASDATSGVNGNPSFTASPSTSNTGTFTQTCTALDYTGNQGSGSDEYTVESGSNPSGGSSGSGGSGDSGGSTWTTTYSYNDENLDEKGPVSKELSTKERISIKLSDETHHVGILTLTSTSAEIEISSTPQKATLNIGESQKFDITDDSFYDVNVTLVSIDNSKANITIEYLHEEIAEDLSNATFDASSQEPAAEESSSTSTLMWIILSILVVVAVAAIVVKFRARQSFSS